MSERDDPDPWVMLDDEGPTMTSVRFTTIASIILLSAAAALACDAKENDRTSATSPESPPAGPQSPDAPLVNPPPDDSPADDESLASIAAYCPMSMSNAAMERVDTDDGVALVFTTTRLEDVLELRQRARHLAQMYEGHGMGGMHGMHPMAAQGSWPEVRATVSDIGLGARIELVPTDQSQREALREHIRRHEQSMRTGACPPMAHHGRSPRNAPPGSGPKEPPSGTQPPDSTQ